jgi:hypothetical protein
METVFSSSNGERADAPMVTVTTTTTAGNANANAATVLDTAEPRKLRDRNVRVRRNQVVTYCAAATMVAAGDIIFITFLLNRLVLCID